MLARDADTNRYKSISWFPAERRMKLFSYRYRDKLRTKRYENKVSNLILKNTYKDPDDDMTFLAYIFYLQKPVPICL